MSGTNQGNFQGAIPAAGSPVVDLQTGIAAGAWRNFFSLLLGLSTAAPAAGPVAIAIAPNVLGPVWTYGSAAPTATAPVGSLYSRVGGAIGATLYVSRGAGVWRAVAGV